MKISQRDQKENIFLSYSRIDLKEKRFIEKFLIKNGYNVVFDENFYKEEDPQLKFSLKSEWWEEIKNMIQVSDVFLALSSNNYIKSKVCLNEFRHADDNKKPIVILRIDNSHINNYPEILKKYNVNINLEKSLFGYKSKPLNLLSKILHREAEIEVLLSTIRRQALQWVNSGSPDSLLMRSDAIKKIKENLYLTDISYTELPSYLLEYLSASEQFENKLIAQKNKIISNSFVYASSELKKQRKYISSLKHIGFGALLTRDFEFSGIGELTNEINVCSFSSPVLKNITLPNDEEISCIHPCKNNEAFIGTGSGKCLKLNLESGKFLKEVSVFEKKSIIEIYNSYCGSYFTCRTGRGDFALLNEKFEIILIIKVPYKDQIALHPLKGTTFSPNKPFVFFRKNQEIVIFDYNKRETLHTIHESDDEIYSVSWLSGGDLVTGHRNKIKIRSLNDPSNVEIINIPSKKTTTFKSLDVVNKVIEANILGDLIVQKGGIAYEIHRSEGNKIKIYSELNTISKMIVDSNREIFLASSIDGEVAVWRTGTCDLIRKWRVNKLGTSAIEYDFDNGILITNSGTGVVKIWNPETGSRIQTLKEFPGDISYITKINSFGTFAVGSESAVCILDLSHPEIFRKKGILAASVSSCSNYCCFITSDHQLIIFDIVEQKNICAYPFQENYKNGLFFDGSGRYVIALLFQRIVLIDWATGSLSYTDINNVNILYDVAIDHSGQCAAISVDSKVVLLDLQTLLTIEKIEIPNACFFSINFQEDESLVRAIGQITEKGKYDFIPHFKNILLTWDIQTNVKDVEEIPPGKLTNSGMYNIRESKCSDGEQPGFIIQKNKKAFKPLDCEEIGLIPTGGDLGDVYHCPKNNVLAVTISDKVFLWDCLMERMITFFSSSQAGIFVRTKIHHKGNLLYTFGNSELRLFDIERIGWVQGSNFAVLTASLSNQIGNITKFDKFYSHLLLDAPQKLYEELINNTDQKTKKEIDHLIKLRTIRSRLCLNIRNLPVNGN